MPTNEAERYLGELAQRSFLKLWTVPNPFKKPGKELADLIVVFGNDLIVVSDKASQFGKAMPLAWERWQRRTIDASLRQLKTAARSIENSAELFFDSRASTGVPLSMPATGDRHLHLIAVVRPSHDPREKPSNWSALSFNTEQSGKPFSIGPTYAGNHFVHVFDGETLEFLLTQLDTAPDFLQYLKSRERTLRNSTHLAFSEKDLFATAIKSWAKSDGFNISLPTPDPSGRTILPADLWTEYAASDGATATKREYANSRNIDALIDHFHTEYAENKMLNAPKPSFDTHKWALRILASESRFSRRIIADALVDLLKEDDNSTIWASSVPSPELPNVRYVWLTYPERPPTMDLRECEQLILRHLRQHLLVARTKFGSATYVGISVPNRNIKMLSYSMCMMDGEDWSAESEAEARHWESQGVFANPEPTQRLYKR
jgi:hypothetical protein